MKRPDPPLSTDVLIRLAGCISQANPTLEPADAVAKARAMVGSLRRAGLDVVFVSWIDDPMTARGLPTAEGDALDAVAVMMKGYLRDLEARKPWEPN